MTGKNHMATALLLSSVVLATKTDISNVDCITFSLVSMVGALVPDIDTPTSKLGRKVPFISIPLNLSLGHRGAMHSLLAGVLVGIGTVALNVFGGNNMWLYAFLLGFVAHLIGDLFTNSGIPLLYPFSKKHYALKVFHTGGICDYLLTVGMTVLALYIYYLERGLTLA